ncbi:glycoside hydrolase family protein [Tsuneonella sp. SYSU-LHT278]|uniref:lysozyme n=1 Tax=Tsuneonella sediminis TaxID=3416089 RepID=UPI003F7920A9
MRTRKTALALSAGVMGATTAAVGIVATQPAVAAMQTESPLARLPAKDLKASPQFKQALVEEEGVRETVYRDVAGHPTVGVGHLVTPADGLRVGQRIGYDRILDFLEEDIAEAEAAVVRVAGDLPLFQHEFDALVDLVFNVGEGNLSAAESPRLFRAIALRDYTAIARELDYRYAGGELARGLAFRSERRTRMFANAEYEDPRQSAGPAATARA